jgi:hypothetical protein
VAIDGATSRLKAGASSITLTEPVAALLSEVGDVPRTVSLAGLGPADLDQLLELFARGVVELAEAQS